MKQWRPGLPRPPPGRRNQTRTLPASGYQGLDARTLAVARRLATRSGAWLSADAAMDFAVLDALGLRSVRPALLATRGDVFSLFVISFLLELRGPCRILALRRAASV